jgi:hypothetical protein
MEAQAIYGPVLLPIDMISHAARRSENRQASARGWPSAVHCFRAGGAIEEDLQPRTEALPWRADLWETRPDLRSGIIPAVNINYTNEQ